MPLPWLSAEKKFTNIQKQILHFQEEGLNINRIAHQLGISVKAIRQERKAISLIWEEGDRDSGIKP